MCSYRVLVVVSSIPTVSEMSISEMSMRRMGLFCLILQLLLLLNVSASAQSSGRHSELMPTEQTFTMKLKVGSSLFLFIPRPGGTPYYWDFDAKSSSGNIEVYVREVQVLPYLSRAPQVGSDNGDLFEIRGSTPGRAIIEFGFRQHRQEPISRIRVEMKLEQ
jgi:hypothetical protein